MDWFKWKPLWWAPYWASPLGVWSCAGPAELPLCAWHCVPLTYLALCSCCMCKCRVPALCDQDGGPTASWGLGQARQMSCQGSDLTDILGACFRKSSCSQLAWQCFRAGADPAASMLVLRRRQQVSSSPTCRDLPASPGSACHHQWAGMAGAPPSVPPFDAVTLCVERPQNHCRGERMHGGVGIGSFAIEKGVWQPWDLFPRYSCTLPNTEYKSCLAARPMKQRCGVFCGEVTRS